MIQFFYNIFEAIAAFFGWGGDLAQQNLDGQGEIASDSYDSFIGAFDDALEYFGLSWEGLAALLVLLAVIITRGVAAVAVGGVGIIGSDWSRHCRLSFRWRCRHIGFRFDCLVFGCWAVMWNAISALITGGLPAGQF